MSCTVDSTLFTVMRPCLLLSKYVGILPVSWHKIDRNHYIIKQSNFLCVFIVFYALAIASHCSYGMAIDISDPKNAIRVKDGKTNYVTICIIQEMTACCVVSMISIPFRMKHFWEFLRNLAEFDRNIPIKHAKRERNFSLIIIIFMFFTIEGNLFYDIFIYLAQYHIPAAVYFSRFIGIYFVYSLAVFVQIPYWQFNRLIYHRIKMLNVYMKSFGEKPKVFGSVNHRTVVKFCKHYHMLRRSAIANNKFCNVLVLMILISCLVHLISNPYLFLKTLRNGTVGTHVSTHFTWFMLHATRLWAIVESSHKCVVEYEKSIDVVYKLINEQSDEIIKEELKTFALNLEDEKLRFDCFKLLKVNRALVTSLVGEAGTYVAILFQSGTLGTDITKEKQ